MWESVGSQPSERWLVLERTAATVRVQELGSGPTVVLVHGVSNSGTSWAPLAARLKGFRCVVIDRPGCGLSPRLDRRHSNIDELGAFADALVVDVLDAIGAQSASVVGTSFGGYFALRAAAAHPDRVDRLVLLGWSFGAPMTSMPLAMRVAAQPRMQRITTRMPVNERMARTMLKQIGLRNAIESGRFAAVEMAWFLSQLRDTDTMRNEIISMPPVVTLRGVNEATLLTSALLARVTMPTYLLWGADDPMGDADIADAFARLLPNAQLEMMPTAGHAPWMDDPDHVADRLAAFIGDGDR